MGYKHLKFEKDDKFLVTGGAGFIGSNIIETLLDINLQCALMIYILGKKCIIG